MSSPSKRREMDIMKLMMGDYKLEMINDSTNEFYIEFHGPKDSLYEGGLWRIHVELPEAYPYKSPSIGFVNRIYHPNVDEVSALFLSGLANRAGSVCLDVINQTWSPMFDLINVFEVFLPQLLLYPNPTDPLNGEAAALLMREPEKYNQKVKEYCNKYAQPEDVRVLNNSGDKAYEEEEDDSDVASEFSDMSDDEEAAGKME